MSRGPHNAVDFSVPSELLTNGNTCRSFVHDYFTKGHP